MAFVYVAGGGIISGYATVVFRTERVKPGDLAIISADEVLKTNFGSAFGKAIFRSRESGDVSDLLKAIQGQKNGKVVIVRGGCLGVELGVALKNNDNDVTMVFPESHCVPSVLTTEISGVLEGYCALKGMDVIKGLDVVSFETKDTGEIKGVKLVGGLVLEADVVFIGACARPITTVKSDEDLGGLKTDAFFKTTVSNLYLVGDVIADKLQDSINLSGGDEVPQTLSRETIISIAKAKFEELLEPKSLNLVLVTGIDTKLSPDCYVDYICELRAPMTRVLVDGPMAIIIAPEDVVMEICSLFENSICRITTLSEVEDIDKSDVVVSTISEIDSILPCVPRVVFDDVRFVVFADVDRAKCKPKRLLPFLSSLRETQVIFICSVFNNKAEEIVNNCTNRRWDLALASRWLTKEDIGKQDLGKE